MKRRTVKVNVGKTYDIIIEPNILSNCGHDIIKVVGSGRVAIITDSNVKKIYLKPLIKSLNESGTDSEFFIFEAGEKSKNIQTLSNILEFLAAKGFVRSDTVIALGGGVVGDIAGFAAAIYLRGIKFIQIPTTLLAAVDSSVGGKTAIDLTVGKNLAGAFKQPELVICDPTVLKTLSQPDLCGGFAEAIKYGLLFDKKLFELFDGKTIDSIMSQPDLLCEITERCVALKGKIVEEDEFDNGRRKLLNYGHTIAHAIEKCSDFSVPHGIAVAVGIAMMARAGERLGITEKGTAKKTEDLLKKYRLPTDTDFAISELTNAALSDKKRSGNEITLVVPKKIGECILTDEPIEELKKYITLGKTH